MMKLRGFDLVSLTTYITSGETPPMTCGLHQQMNRHFSAPVAALVRYQIDHYINSSSELMVEALLEKSLPSYKDNTLPHYPI